MKKGFILRYKKSVAFIFLVLFVSSLFFTASSIAAMSIKMNDTLHYGATQKQSVSDKAKWSWEKGWENLLKNLKEAGSKAFHSALSNALNTVAYDTATWIGSGGEGQQPLFIREGWGEYLTNVADNSAGSFLEGLMGSGGFGNFNLCEPSAGAAMKISLGLTQYARPAANKPDCTFSEMRKNWSQALKSPNFLNDVQNMFDPVSSDVGITFNSYVKMIGKMDADLEIYTRDRETNRGWLDVRNIGDLAETYPGYTEDQIEQAGAKYWDNMGTYTGSALIDAINIFLNQLALTLFQRLMRNIGSDGDTYTNPYDWSSYNAGPYGGGISGAQDKFKKIIQPNFNIRGDYNILAELAMCPDPANAGPTNCVIDEKFRQAIQDKITVAEAIEAGYLNSNGLFGFQSDGLEPSYVSAYPYRSMIILRKFRILPVGWELASQYIKDNANLSGTRNLGDMIACFDANDNYEGYSDAWCRGLVDPDWVLKAPLGYCGREGYGPTILSESVVGEGDESELILSRDGNYCADEQSCIKEYDDGSCEVYGYCTEEKRKWNFQADSCDALYNTCQTFTERENGQTKSFLKNTLEYCDSPGCTAYCEALDYSTNEYCTNPDDPILYLSDAEECDEENEGCHEFIRTGVGNQANLIQNSSFEAPATAYPEIGGILDQDCMGGSAVSVFGDCVGHLRADIYDQTINLFDSFTYDFTEELFTFSLYAKDCGDDMEIRIGGDWVNDYSSSSVSTITDWQRFSVTHVFDAASDLRIWMEIDSVANPSCFVDAMMVERGGIASAYSDYRQSGLLYEKRLPDYLKEECYKSTIPMSVDFNQYRDDAPAKCFDYARECNEEEVDCELYKSTTDGITYPAKVTINDYCAEECVGYSEYLRSSSPFDSQSVTFMIPDRAKKCNKSADGCTEFTNLDKIGDGAENIEYYSELKHCTSSSAIIPNPSCSDYYTWEGSNESGFQLRVHKLKRDLADINGNGDILEPTVVEDDTNECSEDVFNLPPSDPGYNFDCREFFDTAGVVTYHLYSRMVTCSDDCHPYRRTDFNIVKNYLGLDITESECPDDPSSPTDDPGEYLEYFSAGTLPNQLHYNTVTGQCIYCKAGGEWSDDHGACLYNAIPDEGEKCNAGQSGCREYSGSTGNDMEILLNDDFEGNVDSWTSPDGSIANASSYIVIASMDNALEYTPGTSNKITKTINNTIESGKSYYLSFVAMPTAGIGKIVSIGLDNGNEIEEFATNGSTIMSPGWKKYEFNISRLNHYASSSEILFIQMDGGFVIDNIKLIKTTDRYFLIKDSWETPDACYHDIFNNPVGERFNLGCDEYTDREDDYHYLRQFTKACQDSAVGCELMIDTNNYSDYNSGIWNDIVPPVGVCDASDGEECEMVGVDSLTYMVYDDEKICSESSKGCQRLGEIYEYSNELDTTSIYTDVYRINDPDFYDSKLCTESEQDCKSWLVDQGEISFIDPGDNYCTWNSASNKWLQKRVSRCDDGTGTASVDGNIERSLVAPFTLLEDNICFSAKDCSSVTGSPSCSSDDDCGVFNKCVDSQCRYNCLLDDYDYDCPVDWDSTQVKTIGEGRSVVEQPSSNWAGMCPSSESGCTEFIDPISKFNSNVVLNADFSEIVGPLYVNWPVVGGGLIGQNVTLKNNTLYVFGVEGGTAPNVAVFSGPGSPARSVFRRLNEDNRLETFDDEFDMSFGGDRASYLYYVYDAAAATGNVVVSITTTAPVAAKKIFIREAVVEYRFEQDVEICETGEVDFGKGCVLFNKREVDFDSVGSGYTELIYDADINEQNIPLSENPAICSGGAECDSNMLYQVEPDRVCREWLACRSFIKDEQNKNVCYDVGLCDRFDDNNNCRHFIRTNSAKLTYTSGNTEKYSDHSGYSKVGNTESVTFTSVGIENKVPSDLYSFSDMTQFGEFVRLSNGNFEEYDENNYPVGWVTRSKEPWRKSLFQVINNPVKAQDLGYIGYPIEGKAFLSYSSENSDVSPFYEHIYVEPGTDYVVSAYVNTSYLNSKDMDLYENVFAFIDVLGIGGAPVTTFPLIKKRTDSWEFVQASFNTGARTQVSLWIGAGYTNLSGVDVYCSKSATYDNCAGNIYIDDVKIRSVLDVQDSYSPTGAAVEMGRSVPQSCRLFPESDSMACEYFEDSGIKQKGWYGYCLEYDRFPGSTDACLLWYPVDKVRGDGQSEDYGYDGKFPVYYCEEARVLQVLEKRNYTGRVWISGCDINVGPPLPSGYGGCDGRSVGDCGFGSCDSGDSNYEWNACPSGTCIYDCQSNGTGWYQFNGFHSYSTSQCCGGGCGVINEAGEGVRFYDPFTGGVYDDTFAYCTHILQAVDNVGENKYWSSRVYEGSDYLTVNQGFGYDDDEAPFGSIEAPNPTNNPFMWDGRSGSGFEGFQPLYVEGDKSKVRASHPYSYDGVSCTGVPTGSGISPGWIGVCSNALPGTDGTCYHLEGLNNTAGNILNGADCEPGEGTCIQRDFSRDPKESISELFAQSYGEWMWNNSGSLRYNYVGNGNISVPVTTCSDNYRRYHPNLFPNSSYEAFLSDWTQISTDASFGNCSLQLQGSDAARFPAPFLGVASRAITAERGLYTLSLDLRNCGSAVVLEFGPGDETTGGFLSSTITTVDSNGFPAWNRFSVSHSFETGEEIWMNIQNFTGGSCLVDALKVEKGDLTPYMEEYCAIRPVVADFKVDKTSVYGSSYVNFKFTSTIDSQQLPLVMYSVDWGDGNMTTVSGVENMHHPNVSDPHSMYHAYDYWTLKAEESLPSIDCYNPGDAGSLCVGDTCCVVSPSVKIKDNWGWCNNGVDAFPCPAGGYETSFIPIIVYES
jgi:hypothetical protein